MHLDELSCVYHFISIKNNYFTIEQNDKIECQITESSPRFIHSDIYFYLKSTSDTTSASAGHPPLRKTRIAANTFWGSSIHGI